MAKSNVIRIEDYRPSSWPDKTSGISLASEDAEVIDAKTHKSMGSLLENDPHRIKNDLMLELVDMFSEDASDELDKVQINSFKDVFLFLQNFPFETFPKPIIVREPDGCLSLDWEVEEYPENNFSVSFSGNGTVYYAGMFHGGEDNHGKACFYGYNIPAIIIFNLRQLYGKF